MYCSDRLLDGLSYKNLKVASQIVSDYFVQLHNETRTSHRITYNECCRQQSLSRLQLSNYYCYCSKCMSSIWRVVPQQRHAVVAKEQILL